MKNRLPAPVRRLTDSFASFTSGQKAVTIFAVLALAIGGYFFATWLRSLVRDVVQQPLR